MDSSEVLSETFNYYNEERRVGIETNLTHDKGRSD